MRTGLDILFLRDDIQTDGEVVLIGFLYLYKTESEKQIVKSERQIQKLHHGINFPTHKQ